MHLGIVKPHYSVLTHRDFLPENLGDSIDAFYASGEGESAGIENILARHDSPPSRKRFALNTEVV